jgi:hypothetical protein
MDGDLRYDHTRRVDAMEMGCGGLQVLPERKSQGQTSEVRASNNQKQNAVAFQRGAGASSSSKWNKWGQPVEV